MRLLTHYFPNGQHIESLEAADLAGYVLLCINAQNASNFTLAGIGHQLLVAAYTGGQPDPRQSEAVHEALCWLIIELLIMPPAGGQPAEVYRVSRRGRQIRTEPDLEELRQRSLLSKAILHSTIQQEAFPLFLSGRYDAAVFQAFKDLEIAVRAATESDLDGVNLMRMAFRPSNPRAPNAVSVGPLVDPTMQDSEQQGLSLLFSSAVLWCRNPVGHRIPRLTAKESSRLLVYASYLLDLIEKLKEDADRRNS